MKRELSEGWEFCEAGTNNWRSAEVPGHVHLDLMRHGLIEDPFERMNERDCQWVDERDWSYRMRFQWQPSQCSRTILRFEGLDAVCSVWLNGERIAEHDNMFVPLELDVGGRLSEGENELRVDFLSAARVGRERRAAYLAKHELPDDVANIDERAFVRKAQCMFGWDWGPRLVSCGIWRPVVLADEPVEQRPSAVPGAKLIQRPNAGRTSFEYEVNGRPFFALGANWIPDHAFPSQATSDRVRERVQQAKELGCNMLRVWGGGIYEHDAFYDACDDLGILVWQDFMFACSYYPDDPEQLEAIRREAEYQVKRLRHHPCIALWCGGNECHQVWEDGWGGCDRQPPRFHGEAIYHEVLKEVVERLDPGRAYVPNSPWGGTTANSEEAGDQHYWDVWHGRGDWVHYRDSKALFCSEFGFASSPSLEAWKRAGISPDAPVEAPEVRWHNKTGKPFEVFRDLVGLHYPSPCASAEGEGAGGGGLQDWIERSQANQRDALREAIEHFRFSGRCRGALLWQLNDCWPVESWSVLEFGGKPKLAAEELKRLFAPLLLRVVAMEDRVQLWACLHNATDPIRGSAWLLSESGPEWSREVEIKPDEISRIYSMSTPLADRQSWTAKFGESKAAYLPPNPLSVTPSMK